MVKFYHGTTDTDKRINIEMVGLVPAKHTKIRNAIQPYVFLTHKLKYAKYFGEHIIEFNIPRSKIFKGSNEIDWKRSGKPVWDKDYKPEALAHGIPKKYIKAIIIDGVRYQL